jgi:hypothetical protein
MRDFFMLPEKLRDQQAEIIEVKVDRFQFFIFKHENQIFLPTNEGLRVIGVNINWISAMGTKRRRMLRNRGFSFKEKLLCYQIPTRPNNFFFASSYTWLDWLKVWSYFASRGNAKAAQLLRFLAEPGLEHFI